MIKRAIAVLLAVMPLGTLVANGQAFPDWSEARASVDTAIRRLAAEIEKMEWPQQCAQWGRELRTGKSTLREDLLLSYLVSNGFLTSKDRGHASDRSIDVGMTGCGVVAALGLPEKVNRYTTGSSVSMQWVYRRSQMFVYLETGLGSKTGTVRSFQD